MRKILSKSTRLRQVIGITAILTLILGLLQVQTASAITSPRLLQNVTKYLLFTENKVTPNEDYAIVYKEPAGEQRVRILYCYPTDKNKPTVDVLVGTFSKDESEVFLSGNPLFKERDQLWTVKETGTSGEYGLMSHSWLHLHRSLSEPALNNQIPVGNTPSAVTFLPVTGKPGFFKIKNGNNYISYGGLAKKDRFTVGNESNAIEVRLFKKTKMDVFEYPESHHAKDLPLADRVVPSGSTVGQPFIKNETAGSEHFRIPAMITLNNGRILAAADARWKQAGDAAGIDIVVSRSDDHGKNWTYTTPLYHDDSVNGTVTSTMLKASTFIDAALLKDRSDNVYLLADLYPGNVALNTAPHPPAKASGFMEIGNAQRLVLYEDPEPHLQTNDNWTHYVGDFEAIGAKTFAPVYEKDSTADPKYYIDDAYNLYDKAQKPLYSRQLGNDTHKVPQNVFYYRADLHVRCSTYLVLIKSTDKGVTWSTPKILNPQLLRPVGDVQFYGVGPGTGLTLKDGTLVFSVYEYDNGRQRASFIYSKDGGETWKRSEDATKNTWSSESAIIELDDNTLRQFVRHGANVLQYTDYKRSGDTWKAEEPVQMKDIKVDSNCMISAIKLPRTLKNKPVVLISAPGTVRRMDGKIFAFTLDEKHVMTKISEYNVKTRDGVRKYAYSCLTYQGDDKIGLLAEDGANPEEIIYKTFDFETLAGADNKLDPKPSVPPVNSNVEEENIAPSVPEKKEPPKKEEPKKEEPKTEDKKDTPSDKVTVPEEETPRGEISSREDEIAFIKKTKEYKATKKAFPVKVTAVAEVIENRMKAVKKGKSYTSKKGTVLKNTFAHTKSFTMYFDSKGHLLRNTFLVTHDDSAEKIITFYAGKNGRLIRNKIVKLKDGSLIYLDKAGVLARSRFVKVKGKTYYAAKSGKLVTGKRITVKGTKYFCDKKASLQKSVRTK